MKRLLLLLVTCFCLASVQAAYLRDIPVTVTQPDGTELQCFASGDEYFHYLHDKDGYTIMQHPETGYYVYAETRDGKLTATDIIAGRQDPASMGLTPYALITPEEWMARRRAWQEPEKRPENRDGEPNHGTLNNIAIFLRFSDDAELTNSFTSIDNMFNDVSSNAVSMRAYFRAASYGNIEIPTHFFPGHNGNTIISYQDTYPRSYFKPYNSTTNPNGYQNYDERTEREHALLERAVNYINTYYPIPTSLNIDYDNDGYVDNVCFIVKGNVGGWDDLLWPHKWSLYTRSVYINGKRVWTFNFQLADGVQYFTASTMCHEMNHSLSAPDLYHYYNNTNIHPAGTWDLMEYNSTPPQHCGAYMKMKYGHWVDDIPEITQPGVYTLNPISSATPDNIAYKITSSDPNQFYVVEYRDNTSLFESALPGSGLLVYRIDTRFDGNAYYDPSEGVYDEVYIFRPNGTTTANGNYNNAHFSLNTGRTEFSASTNPYPFFSNGTIDNEFRIFDISATGSTISFTYGSATPTYTIAVSAYPSNGGTVTGGGTYELGTSCTVTATPATGFDFLGWKEGSTIVSTDASYTFVVSENRTLVASFYMPGIGSVTANYYPDPNDPESPYVKVTWDGNNPPTPEGQWYHYGDETLTNNIGANGAFYWAVMFPAGTYTGNTVSKVATYATGYEAFTGTVTIYNDLSATPSTAVGSMNISVPLTIGMYEMEFPTPITIDPTKNLWVVMYNASSSNYVAGACADSGDANARWVSLDGSSWFDLAGSIQGCSWILEVYVEQSFKTDKGTTDIQYYNVYRTDCSNQGPYTPSNTTTLTTQETNTYYIDNTWQNADYGVYKYGVSYVTDSGTESDIVWSTCIEKLEPIIIYQITASANPTAGGNVTGSGNYEQGTTCTLTATANSAYNFTNWTKNGTVVSTSTSYSFTVNESASYVANFTLKSYTIAAIANPAAGGSVTGAGTYNHGANATLTATANTGYTFVNWKSGSTVVSTNATYNFTVTSSGTYTAYFSRNSYEVSVTADPAEGGIVTGGGNYLYGETATVGVTANPNYTFDHWTLNGTTVSSEPQYSFEVTGNCQLVAHIVYNESVDENDDTMLSVYPNPAQEIINLTGATMQMVMVYNAMGQLVIVKDYDNVENVELNIDGLVPGFYTIAVQMTDGTIVKKTVIKGLR